MARRFLRWSLRIAAGLIGVVVLGVLAMYLTAQTEWGRDQVRRTVEDVVGSLLETEVTIGGLEGDLAGRIVLTGVTVKDRAGLEAVRIGRVEASYALLPLLSHTVHLRSVVVTDLVVHGRRDGAGKLNLATLLPAPSDDETPSPWRIVVDEARIETGGLFLDERLLVDRAAMRAGGLGLDGTQLRLEDVALESGASRVTLRSLAATFDGTRISGRLAADLRAQDVRRFAPHTPWRADVLAAGTFERTGAAERVRVALAGTLGGAVWSLGAAAPLDARSLAAVFTVDGLDPSAVWEGAPSGLLHVEASAELVGRALAEHKGPVRLAARGVLLGHQLQELAASGTLEAGALRGTVAVRVDGDRLDGDAILDLLGEAPRVRSARVHATVVDLSATLDRVPGLAGLGLDGQAGADLTIHGAIDDLSVEGTIQGRRLRRGQTRVESVTAIVDVRGLPRAPVGAARLTAAGIAQGTTSISAARATVGFGEGGRRIDVTVASEDAKAGYALAATGHLERAVDGEMVVEVANLELRTRAGTLRAHGRVGAAGGRVELTARDLRLEELARLAPPELGLSGLRGTLSARVVGVQRGGRPLLSATIAAREVAWRTDVDPMSLDVEVTLDGRLLRARIRGDGRLTGKLDVRADVRAPAHVLDFAAWRRLDERSLIAAHADVAGLDLERAAALAGIARPLAGRLHAVVDAGPALSTIEARLDGEGIETGTLDRPVSGRAQIAIAGGWMTVAGGATRAGGGRVAIEARLAVPAHLSGWRSSRVDRATVTIEDVELAWLDPLRRVLPGVAGQLTVTATGGPAGVEADLHVTDARADGIASPIDVHVHATVGPERLVARLSSTMAGQRLLDGDASLGVGLRALAALDVEAFLHAALGADLRMARFPLALAGSTFGVGVAMSGSIDARLGITGSLISPAFVAGATLHEGRVAGITFGRFEAAARLADDGAAASLSAAQQGGGSLDVKLELDPRDASSGTVRVQAKQFDLGFLAALGPAGLHVEKGLLAADLKLDRTQVREGFLELTAAELRVTEVLETFRDASLELKVARDGGFQVALRSKVGLKGNVELAGEGKLAGLAIREARGTFRASKLSVSTGRSRVGVDTTGRFTGVPGEGYGLDVVLGQTSLSLPKETGGSLHSTSPLEDVTFVDAEARAAQRLNPARADTALLALHVTTPAGILVRSDEVRAYLSVDLEIALRRSFSVIRGLVRIDRGYLELFGRRWNFQSSRVSFDGEVPPNPSLDITLTHDFRAAAVSILLKGTAKKPEVVLSSAGAYDRSQLLGFVLGGSPDDTGPATERDLSQQTLSTAGGFLFGQIQPLLRKIVPVDVLAVKQKSGTSQLDTITVGKWLSKDIFVAYAHRFADQGEDAATANANEGLLEWYLLTGMRLDLVAGDRGEGSADVLWIRRW